MFPIKRHLYFVLLVCYEGTLVFHLCFPFDHWSLITPVMIVYSVYLFIYIILGSPMSTQHKSRVLRDPANPPLYLSKRARTNWIRNAEKELKNYRYKQQYPPFYIPDHCYRIFHVHKFTKSYIQWIMSLNILNIVVHTVSILNQTVILMISL
ncbi:unnamed protein product [Rotaria socialis]|uniref:Uncharacterized protein n=1 Tax=Rotaria socialis TaxID=392032 RepID=A0A818AX77_9BILA|nr:unnamed protein product [Rotaria socialis]CAF4584743.1 unnamed protein product [Rotaria socialis]